MIILYIFLAIYAYLVMCWVLYLAVMNLYGQKDSLHPVAKFHAYGIILPVGKLADAILNVFFCLVVFQRVPKDWMLTGTLKRMINTESGWRVTVSSWICRNLLNQFDPKGKHC